MQKKTNVKSKIFKRLAPAIICVCLLVCTFVANSMSAQAAEFDGYIKISTKQDFYNIRNNPSGKYYLANDIAFTSLDYTAMGDFYGGFTGFNTFSGTLDGCGHVISGLEASYGIVSTNNGTIKNLEFTDCTFEEAGFVYNNYGSIINCKITDSVVGFNDSTNTAAGIALYNNSGALIEYCSADDCEIAGRAGITYSNRGGVINYCVNRTDFCNDNSNNIGGIAAINSGEITNCINYGEIDMSRASVGGICADNTGKIERCANYANITTKGSIKVAAGISASNYSYRPEGTLYIKDCINYGVIKAMSANNSYGISDFYAGQNIYCVNMGKVYNGSGYAVTEKSQDSYNCYYLSGSGVAPGTSFTSSAIKESTFSGFDFANIWEIENGEISLRCEEEFTANITPYQLPSQTIYNRGEQLNLSDMKVLSLGSLGTWRELQPNEYTVSGYNPNTLGEQEVTVSSGDNSFEFLVCVMDSISYQTITLSQNTCEYTGDYCKPVVTVKDRITGRSLLEGRDYTIEYSDNRYLGTASITITGNGNYKGTTVVNFEIVPPALGEYIIPDPTTGKCYYYNDGVISYKTGLVYFEDEWYYVKQGVLSLETTLLDVDGELYYIENGVWVQETGFAEIGEQLYYIVEGIKSDESGLFEIYEEYYYINGGVWNKVTDLVWIDGVWYYIEEGKWASDIDTLHKINGKWFLVKGGIWNKTTGLVPYKGKTFYVVGGKWDASVTDLKKVDGKWYYIQYGKWANTIDTLHKINGKWFLIKKGMWNKTTGLVDYKGKTFYVVGGKWDSSVNTLYKSDGYFHAIKSGKWYMGKSIITYKGKRYYVDYGYAQVYYSGKVKIGKKTYTVKNGIIK